MTSIEPQKILDARARLESWIESQDFAGYDTHDALTSPWLGWVGRKSRLLGIGFAQVLRRSPLNLRPLLRIKAVRNPKAIGLIASSYLAAYRLWGEERFKTTARSLLDWLRENSSKRYSGYCWGYPFDWPNRGFFAPAGTPTAVNTSFIAHAFLDAYEFFHERDFLDVARSCCDFCLRDLHILREDDAQCFSYTPLDQRWIHNANFLVARLLARVGYWAREGHLMEESRRAAKFSLRAQQPDGSWPYGTSRMDRWVDNFHTGFVLDALSDLHDLTQLEEYDRAWQKGYEYYRMRFFRPDGLPTYYPHRAWPIDVHVVAQSIITPLRYAPHDPEVLDRACRLAHWAIDHMQDARGYFWYRVGRWTTNRIPYLRWGQAWMLRALTSLAVSLASAMAEKPEMARAGKQG